MKEPTDSITPDALHTSRMPALDLWRRGKVRDLYDLGDHLLMVATDRISAYDVIMEEPIPGKGALLTDISVWWFGELASIVDNHLVATDVDAYPEVCRDYRDQLVGRSMLVEKTDPLPVECVARGYLAGSGYREYRESGEVCGVSLPEGLTRGSRLPEPIFTPATKAEEGHDENITFDQAAEILGRETAEEVRELTLKLYRTGSERAAEKGIIIADTKFEFGRRKSGEIILIDEALTPDSSRFWLASEYREGEEPVNFDKQYLRDWLESSDWDKSPPPPTLPAEVIAGTRARYAEARDRLLGNRKSH